LVHQVHLVTGLRALASQGGTLRVHVLPSGSETGNNSLLAGETTQKSSTTTRCFECKGAVLSVRVSRDERLLLVNVRPFLDESRALANSGNLSARFAAPDIDTRVVLQVWEVSSGRLLHELEGPQAFTTKDCPFLLFTHDTGGSLPPPPHMSASLGAHLENTTDGGLPGPRNIRGGPSELVCSGSEDKAAYVFSLRHGVLVKVLRGHQDVVSAASWSPTVRGLVATASDDCTVRFWGRPSTIVLVR